jgi:restriction system protein
MAVPDFQSFFRPLLELAADGKEHSLKEAREQFANKMALAETELLPSGNQTKYENRIAWAKSYFVQAGVLRSTRRGFCQITDRGKELLNQGHKRIDVKILSQYPEFVEFHSPPKSDDKVVTSEIVSASNETPEEALQRAYRSIRNDLAGEPGRQAAVPAGRAAPSRSRTPETLCGARQSPSPVSR